MIHPTAIISKEVKLGSNVKIGPYVYIDGNVSIGDNTEILASSSITGNTSIVKNRIDNKWYHYNDEKPVQEVTNSSIIINKNAYLLFYYKTN